MQTSPEAGAGEQLAGDRGGGDHRAALVAAANRAAAHGGSLHVVCARPQIRRLFRLTGLDRRLAPARTLDQALDALMAAGAPLR